MKREIPLTTGPTAMLRHEHEVILGALALLERLGEDLATGRPVDREALGWLVDFFRTFADRYDHGREEQHLFPALERHGLPREGPRGRHARGARVGREYLRAMAGEDGEVVEAIRGYVRVGRLGADGSLRRCACPPAVTAWRSRWPTRRAPAGPKGAGGGSRGRSRYAPARVLLLDLTDEGLHRR